MSRYVIVDLEMCRVFKSKRPENMDIHCELIQIGAVLLDKELRFAEKFVTYVHPRYGSIDPFIEKLTGIKNEDTENAPDAAEALRQFAEWLPDDAVIVSWSDTDLNQIIKETEMKEIYIPKLEKYYDTWIDCQASFGEKLNTDKAYKLSEALLIAGIYYEDGEHDALIDAENTALLFAKMEREPIFKPSPYYSFGNSESDHCFTLGSLF